MTDSSLIDVFPNGRLIWRGREYRCALGRGGVARDKREGDGATPVGAYPLRRLHYRADKSDAPKTRLPVRPIGPDDGWCDDPKSADYNRPVTLPFAASHEKMWRDDALYDLVIEIGHNDDPPVPGLGSAVFMHVAKLGYAPTEGCVALAKPDLQALLADWGPDTVLRVNEG